jgi:hypothetical protein
VQIIRSNNEFANCMHRSYITFDINVKYYYLFVFVDTDQLGHVRLGSDQPIYSYYLSVSNQVMHTPSTKLIVIS